MPVVSCYEADRAGFWLHRFLQAPRAHQPWGRFLCNRRQSSHASGQERWGGRAQGGAHAAALPAWRALGMACGPWALGGGRASTASAPGLGNPEAGKDQYDSPPQGLAQEPGDTADERQRVARATRRAVAVGWGADARGPAPSCAARVRPSHVLERADCGRERTI